MKKQVLLPILVPIALLTVGCTGLQDSGSASSESPLASAESSADLLPDASASTSGGEAEASGSAGPTPSEAPLSAKEESAATAPSPEPEPPVEVSDPLGAAGSPIPLGRRLKLYGFTGCSEKVDTIGQVGPA